MSRKSRRRRMRDAQSPAQHDGFDFFDDRTARAPVAPDAATPVAAAAPVATAAPAAAAVPALAKPVTIEVDLAPAFAAGSPEHDHGAVAVAAPPESASEPGAAPSTAAVEAAPTPSAPPAAPLPTVGEMLIAAREARGLSIDAASARTRISSKMLQHLEADRFDEFAAGAYARGTLRAYGAFLGVDLTALLGRYEAATGVAMPAAALPGGTVVTAPAVTTIAAPRATRPVPAAAAAVPRRPARTAPGARRALAIAAGVIVVAGAGVVGFAAWRHGAALRPQAGLNQIESELRRTQPEPTAVSEAPVPLPGPVAVPARAGEDTAPVAPGTSAAGAPAAGIAIPAEPPITDLVETPNPAPAAGAGATAPGGLVLTAIATGPCTVRLTMDGARTRTVPFNFTQAGESRSWTARKSFRLIARRSANLQLELNGRPISTPPDGRAVILNRFTLEPKTVPAAPRRARPRPRVKPAAPVPAPVFEPHSGMLPPH